MSERKQTQKKALKRNSLNDNLIKYLGAKNSLLMKNKQKYSFE